MNLLTFETDPVLIVKHLPEGVYIYEIRSEGLRLQSGKMVIQ